jgi:hypothetical protein
MTHLLLCLVPLLQLREELGNARENNDLTADETTKLLLENSHLQQVRRQGNSEQDCSALLTEEGKWGFVGGEGRYDGFWSMGTNEQG